MIFIQIFNSYTISREKPFHCPVQVFFCREPFGNAVMSDAAGKYVSWNWWFIFLYYGSVQRDLQLLLQWTIQSKSTTLTKYFLLKFWFVLYLNPKFHPKDSISHTLIPMAHYKSTDANLKYFPLDGTWVDLESKTQKSELARAILCETRSNLDDTLKSMKGRRMSLVYLSHLFNDCLDWRPTGLLNVAPFKYVTP